MSLETFVLGVISGLRPATSQAALVALLKTADPRRALLFFITAGFAASMLFGLVLVLVLHGGRVNLGGSTFTALVNLVAGVAAIAYAIGFRQGRVSVPRRARREPRPARTNGTTARFMERLRNPSVLTAAVAGIATHVPGLVYLVALNAVAAQEPTALEAVIQVGLYNALWFALPLAALALAILRPGRAPEYLERATGWGRRHEQGLVFAILIVLGAYLVIKGAVRLA